MILTIISYGHSVLRQKCKDIDQNYPDLNFLIDSMWETLLSNDGWGLAAPQVNYPIKLFIIYNKENEIKETFINANIIKYSSDLCFMNEGCLSIPSLFEDVERPKSIEIEYLDRNFQKQVKSFGGITARIIQHEYDHTIGKLYLDYLSPIKKKLLNNKLINIYKGKIKVDYKIKYLK